MNTKPNTLLSVLAVSMAFAAFEATAMSQVQTTKSTETHAPTVTTTVARGEVVYVSGNQLVVKMEDGTMRDFPNVPESARVTVNGQQMGIHDLKPGMKLEKTITTTTTPKTITTVQTVTGKVWHVNAPSSVILTLEDGTNQQFKVPKGQTFMVNGNKTDVFGLRKGMKVTATKVVEESATEVAQHTAISGQLPPPPPPDAPILIAVAVPTPAPAAAAAPEKELPKTGSPLPLIGLLGLLCLAGSFTLKVSRNRA
ncbi:LPXTG cell wall anchor domain-containing protein [Occallatibacter riparius]|uniref:LPXTG cell wall anchor domain-containing protein n=1 Tax=Occallatibacter riparius TaxID=1002689 RepID=A0A9J7BT79_9BACT|nr:LPXTG cell wall anchor domain-containing protein [Occallatibacter riparius]UWZ86084.1 LPXTG cell wall anchor domain-containing protein [Occallatibacter riparius]